MITIIIIHHDAQFDSHACMIVGLQQKQPLAAICNILNHGSCKGVQKRCVYSESNVTNPLPSSWDLEG